MCKETQVVGQKDVNEKYSDVIGLPGTKTVTYKWKKGDTGIKGKFKWLASMWKTPAYKPVVPEIGGISMHVVENGQCEEVSGLQS